MNSKERLFKMLAHEPVDRLPVIPYIGNWGAKLAGYSLGEYHTDGKKMADAHIRAYEMHGLDAVIPQSDNYYIAQGLGVEVEIQEDATPVVKKVPLSTLDQVGKIKVPNPYTDGRMPVYLEAIQILHDKLGKEVVIRTPGTGAFTLAGHMMGIDNFIMHLATAEIEEDEDAQKRLLELIELCTQSLLAFVKAALACGATIVQSGDSLSSINMISPAIYKKYAFPSQAKFFSAMKELQKEKQFATLLHVCGKNDFVAKDMMATGCDCLEVDHACDLKYYKELSKESNTCIIGNLNPAGKLLSGTPDQVYEESMKVLQTAGLDNFFILGSGCELALATPLENVKSMLRASKDFAGR
ncbi:MAG: hypothetical protein HFI33_01800 [Lachnospiraceae bacterium]|nr:hypothetical protein [Lachnospiraceae bacterium]